MRTSTKVMMALFMVAALLLQACYPTGGCDGGGSDGDLAVIESEYAASGSYATTSTAITGYQIYYPRDMAGNHPIITWGNGTFATPIAYAALLNHLASWGFVVIASTSTMTGTGEEMIAGIDYLIEQNSTPGSIFYGKLDTAHIGATGHSQGGGGAINAATDARVTCSAPLAPAPGDASNLKGPMLLVAGAEDTTVSAALVRWTSYTLSRVPTIFAIHGSMGHMDFAYDGGGARGYLTAWFMYQLQGDDYAAQAFTDGCEICANTNWQVETKNY